MSELNSRTILAPLGAGLGIAFGVTVVLITVFHHLAGPMSVELGVSQETLSGALSLHLGVLILALPLAGVVGDRLGAQRTASISACLYGGCLLWLSRLSGSALELYAAFALAALLGAGASPVTYARAMVARFDTSRGAALGIALAGVGAASIILPPLIESLLPTYGWRGAFGALALLAAAAGVSATLALRVVSDRAPIRTTRSAALAGATLTQAMGTPAFWRLALAFVLLGVSLSGVIAHLTELWEGLMITAATATEFQMVLGVATILGRLAGGVMMDRWPANRVGAVFGLLGALGLLTLMLGGGTLPLLMSAIGLGLCLGAESDVASYLVSRYFGVGHFARIYAVQASAFMIGLAMGPILFALGLQALDCRPLLVCCAAGVAVSAWVLAALRPPTPPHS